jgi:dihydroorotase
MSGTITFRNAELLLPGGLVPGDLSIVDGTIAEVGAVRRTVGEEVDATGLMLMPGVIDPQVHFREPGLEHKEDLESGSKAAAAGGVTAFMEMPNTKPNTITVEAFEDKLKRFEGRARAHHAFFFGATPENPDLVARLEQRPGLCGLKIFMGSSTGNLLVDSQEALEAHFAGAQIRIAVHAEDETRLGARLKQYAGQPDPALHPIIRDVESALIATKRAVDLSERHNQRLHVLHVSTAEEVEFLRGRKGDGRVTCETLPQYLWLDSNDYERLGTRAQMNPPIRDPRTREQLWIGLHDGTIDCIATDHAPHTREEKAQPYGKAPSGMPGVETSLPLMLHAAHRGRCTLDDVRRWMCEAPARLYGLSKKGHLAPGMDGDVTLVDLKQARTMTDAGVWSRSGWTPYAGWTLHGWPIMTVLLGRPVFREGDFVDGVYGEPLDCDPC